VNTQPGRSGLPSGGPMRMRPPYEQLRELAAAGCSSLLAYLPDRIESGYFLAGADHLPKKSNKHYDIQFPHLAAHAHPALNFGQIF
jgi:hypothetical protein